MSLPTNWKAHRKRNETIYRDGLSIKPRKVNFFILGLISTCQLYPDLKISSRPEECRLYHRC